MVLGRANKQGGKRWTRNSILFVWPADRQFRVSILLTPLIVALRNTWYRLLIVTRILCPIMVTLCPTTRHRHYTLPIGSPCKGSRREAAACPSGILGNIEQDRKKETTMVRPNGRVKIGECAVDSGQILLIDPCYLNEWKAGDFKGMPGEKGVSTEPENNYDETCRVTCGQDAGPVFKGLAVATESGYGDGSYPVYATFKNGRVQSVTIKFF
jgi:hypothetical protein